MQMADIDFGEPDQFAAAECKLVAVDIEKPEAPRRNRRECLSRPE